MPDFLTSLQHFESGGRNIPNTTQGTSSGQAQGLNQITTGTWHEFGGDVYAPTPLEATPEQQNAIAAKIPMGRWAPETLAYLRNQGFSVNPKTTLADNIAANHGTLGTASSPHSETPGTTLNATATQPSQMSPFDKFRSGDIKGGIAGLSQSVSGQPGQGSPMDAIRPKSPAPQGMSVPNLQAHAPNMAMAMGAVQAAQSNQLQPLQHQNVGGLGGLGGMQPIGGILDPRMMMMGGFYG